VCNITSTGSNKHWIGPYAILDGLDCGIFCDVESVAFKRRSKKNRLMLKPAIRIQAPKNKSPCLGCTQQAIEATAVP
jgi:hypothetical protein